MISPLYVLTYTCCIQDMCWLTRHARQEYEVQEGKHTGTKACHSSHYCHTHAYYLQQSADIPSTLRQIFRAFAGQKKIQQSLYKREHGLDRNLVLRKSFSTSKNTNRRISRNCSTWKYKLKNKYLKKQSKYLLFTVKIILLNLFKKTILIIFKGKE